MKSEQKREGVRVSEKEKASLSVRRRSETRLRRGPNGSGRRSTRGR